VCERDSDESTKMTILMPRFTQEELHEKLRLSMHNKNAVIKAGTCGCYFCLRTFDASEVKDWIDADEDTGLCPHYDIDALLPGITDVETLTQMNVYAFTGRGDE
jgi:hypothetical protein